MSRRAAPPAPRPTVAARVERTPLDPLERETLTLLLRYPALAQHLDDGRDAEGRLPFRDAAELSLVEAWRGWVAEPERARDIEGFVARIDPATAALARGLLADLAAEADPPRLDPEAANDAFRTCLLRLRTRRIEEAIRDGRVLLEEAQRDRDGSRLEELEQQIAQLGREKAEVTRMMEAPASIAGTRRS